MLWISIDKFPPDCLNCASFRLETHFKCITAALSMLCVGLVRFGLVLCLADSLRAVHCVYVGLLILEDVGSKENFALI